jgi:hypothetical protein
MSLFKIDERLKAMGLSEAHRAEIIEMVREFAAAVVKRMLWV